MSNTLWSTQLMARLFEAGIRHIGIAPGSRSTPLVLAAARHGHFQTHVHWDERALGFWGLGIGKSSGTPAAIITTSGTAAANLFPAVIEAAMDQVPLILLTADRPPDLMNCGANQAINQVHLFGNYPAFFADLPAPPDAPLSALDPILDAALAIQNQPIHLNCRFREPFFEDKGDD
ncbi:MAG: thiamine pyrophosphate-binding protein [Candidatus Margulisiibacteriota bacterium]